MNDIHNKYMSYIRTENSIISHSEYKYSRNAVNRCGTTLIIREISEHIAQQTYAKPQTQSIKPKKSETFQMKYPTSTTTWWSLLSFEKQKILAPLLNFPIVSSYLLPRSLKDGKTGDLVYSTHSMKLQSRHVVIDKGPRTWIYYL